MNKSVTIQFEWNPRTVAIGAIIIGGVIGGITSLGALVNRQVLHSNPPMTSARTFKDPARPVTFQTAPPTANMVAQPVQTPAEPLTSAVPTEPAPAVTQAPAPTGTTAVTTVRLEGDAPRLTQAVMPSKKLTEQRTEPQADMPQDVGGYLQRLYETEQQRGKLATGQIGSLIGTFASLLAAPAQAALDDGDGFQLERAHARLRDIAERSRAMRADWQRLEPYLHGVPVPAECQTLDAAYVESLRQTATMLDEIAAVCTAALEDPHSALSRAMSMKGTSSGRIDRSAQRADALLGEIFGKYRVARWFDIRGDHGVNLWGG